MANGSANLFDLAAKISVDASGSDKALTETQKKVLALAEEFKKTEAAAKKSTTGIGGGAESMIPKLSGASNAAGALDRQILRLGVSSSGVNSSLTSLVTTSGVLQSSLTATAAGIAGLVLAAGGFVASVGAAVKGLFDFTVKSTDAGDHLFDMSKKIDLSVTTLSAMSNAAKTSGTSIDTLKSSLIIFQKNLEQVREGNKGLGTAFKNLQIDTSTTEAAIRSAFLTLSKMPDGYNKTAAATRLFGRSGTEVLAVIAETNGNLDEAINKYRDLGTLIGSEGAKKAADFSDQYKILNSQLDAVSRTIAEQLMPTFLKMMQDLSGWLKDNKDNWQSWGVIIRDAVAGVVYSPEFQLLLIGLKYLASFDPKSDQPSADVYGPGGIMRGGSKGMKSAGSLPAPDRAIDLGLSHPGSKGTDPAKTQERLADIALKQQLDNIKIEESALERSLRKREVEYTEYYYKAISLEDERHTQTLGGLVAEMAGAEKIAKIGDRQIQIATVKSKQSAEENRHKEALAKIEDDITNRTRERIKTEEVLLQHSERQRVVLSSTLEIITAIRDRVVGQNILKDLGGGSVVFREPAERGRVVTTDKQVAMERAQIIHDRMAQLAGDLTNTLDRAVYDGFSKGAVRGFATLGQGLLDIVNRIFLARLEKGLTDILTNLGTSGGGGGGFWGKLLGLGIGAISGGFGGGGAAGGAGTAIAGAFAGGFAGGGFIPPGQWGWTGENGPEPVFGGRSGATVVPSGAGGHVTFNIYTPDARSFASRETQAQIARKYQRALQKRALNS